MITPALDPILHVTLRATLALLFVWSASHKLRDVTGFRAALANYQLVPDRWLGSTAMLLTAAELGIAIGLCFPASGARAAFAAAGLLALYAAAIATNLVRGRRDIDCGCAGVAGQHPLSAALVARNGILGAAALASALPVAPRSLTWVDGMTACASVAMLALLYAAVDGLMANAPHSRSLSRTTHHQSRVTTHA